MTRVGHPLGPIHDDNVCVHSHNTYAPDNVYVQVITLNTFQCLPPQESCYCFWPESSGTASMGSSKEVYGKLTVTLKRLSGHGDITERRLEVVESEGTSPHRIVTLLQLSSWPLEEVPRPSAILSLVDLLSKAQRTSPSRHIIVMCRY